MKIDWASLGLVALTTVVAAVSIVGIFSIGVVSLTTAASRTAAGRGGGLTRFAGYACLVVAALIALYGIYLIIPAFH
jgi:hypothetical protein